MHSRLFAIIAALAICFASQACTTRLDPAIRSTVKKVGVTSEIRDTLCGTKVGFTVFQNSSFDASNWGIPGHATSLAAARSELKGRYSQVVDIQVPQPSRKNAGAACRANNLDLLVLLYPCTNTEAPGQPQGVTMLPWDDGILFMPYMGLSAFDANGKCVADCSFFATGWPKDNWITIPNMEWKKDGSYTPEERAIIRAKALETLDRSVRFYLKRAGI